MCRDNGLGKKKKAKKRQVQFPYHGRPEKLTPSEMSEAVSLVLLLLWSAIAKSSKGTSFCFPFNMRKKNCNTKEIKNEEKLGHYLAHSLI